MIWVLSFFALTSRSHQKTDHDHLWLKMRVSAHDFHARHYSQEDRCIIGKEEEGLKACLATLWS